jgi:hypothetical protein
MKNKSKALLRQATPKEVEVKGIKLLKKKGTTSSSKKPKTKKEKRKAVRIISLNQSLAQAKKEWYNGLKLFFQTIYIKESDFQPTVFFLVKEGNIAREYSLAYPVDADNDNGLLTEMIREECRKHVVIAYCCVFATTQFGDDALIVDNMGGVRLIFEANGEQIVSDLKFKGGKISFEQEKKDYEHSKEKCMDGLCALLYSDNESVPIRG